MDHAAQRTFVGTRRAGVGDGFGISTALLTMTEASTDNAAHDGTTRRDPIGEHDGQRNRTPNAIVPAPRLAPTEATRS